ncbi:MAG: GNAT family N-acetyltransferase [Actinomycetota bacterium]|nr:GNAT family N-acetyltransferase [Actinomycetota bacterium]
MTATEPAISVVPANEASWEDLQTVFGIRGEASRCQCQRYKMRPRESFASFPAEERAGRLREQTDCGHPESGTTSGLVAYLDDEPIGWCAVEPRTAYGGCCATTASPGRVARRTRPTTELHVGTEDVFADAGFTEVSRPTLRRIVMRVDF